MARAKTLKLKAGTNIRLTKDDTSVTVGCISDGPSVTNDKIKIYDIEIIADQQESTGYTFDGTPSAEELISLLVGNAGAGSLAILRVMEDVGEGIKNEKWYYLQDISGWHIEMQSNMYVFTFIHTNAVTSISHDVITCNVGKTGEGYSTVWTLSHMQ